MASKTFGLALFVALAFLFLAPSYSTAYNPSLPPPPTGTCPIDTLQLGVCADVLNGLLNVIIGNPPKQPCCTLISGLADLEAAVCLCTAIKAGVLGNTLNIPLEITLLLNYCGKTVPTNYQCA